MSREEKIAMLQAAFAGDTDLFRQYQQEFERGEGGAIWEGDFHNIQVEDRVVWWRKDGTPVVELATAFMQREGWNSGIHLPHNRRDEFFD